MKEEKPKYGWYAAEVIKYMGPISIIGIIVIVLGFVFNLLPINIILWIIGIVISIVFFWPTLGLLFGNILIPRMKSNYEFLNAFTSPKILDCGCGTGLHAIKLAKQLCNGGFLEGIDIYDVRAISGNALQRVQKNAELEGVSEKTNFQVGSITDIPFEDNSFDIISVQSVLHELHEEGDDNKAINELYRVLKDDGLLDIGEWNRNSIQCVGMCGIFAPIFKPMTYWETKLHKNGFKVIKKEINGGFVNFFAKKE